MIEGEVVARAAILANESGRAGTRLNRVKAGCVVGLTKVLSDTTLGSFISKLGERTARS